jgi:REP element-mobilizing transposase RayT
MPNPTSHRRRSIRLCGYDYTLPGAYYVTIVTRDRACILGEIVEGAMRLSDAGRIVEEEWRRLAETHPHLTLDAYVIMPNHVHGIVVLCDGGKDTAGGWATGGEYTAAVAPTSPAGPAPESLGALVGQVKSVSSRRINTLINATGNAVWQRNYYEHVIRGDRDLDAIREYILRNPAQWAADRETPAAQPR